MKIDLKDIETFADGLDHPECIAYHPDGTLWAGGEAGQVYRISPQKSVEEVANTGGFILGIAISPDLKWLAVCDLKNHCVWKLDLETFSLNKFADGAEGHTFNIPNFPVFDSKGQLYVSESGNFRAVNGKILRFKANHSGEGEVWHPGPFNFANGMALSEDEKDLFVVCTWLPGVEKIAIASDGSPGDRQVYATMPNSCPDGCALDQAGNLLVSCYAPNQIYQVNDRQEVRLLVDDWEGHTLSNPTNIAFGGENLEYLFTANLGRWHINRLKADAPGIPLVCHKNTIAHV